MPITYSAGTIVQAEFDNDTIQHTLDGIKDNLVTAGWTLTNSSGGYTLRSAKTPQGLTCTVRLQQASSNVSVQFNTIDSALSLLANLLSTSSGRKLKIIANKYQFFVYLAEGAATVGTAVMGGVPHIHPHHAPMPISAVNLGTPTTIDTATPHGMVDGMSVFLADLEGSGISGLNASWTIQVVNSTRVRLLTSSFSGSWTSGTGYMAGPGRISRLIWSMADSNGAGSERACLRNSVYPNVGYNIYASVALNQLNWTLNGAAQAGRPGIILPAYGVRWYNNQFINAEPYLIFGASAAGATGTVNAQIWDAVAVNYSFTGDLVTSFDGHAWMNYTGQHSSFSQNGALFLAVS